MKNSEIQFIDSIQVEDSFYEAFRNHDLKLMQKVWDTSDDVICIHPGSSRIYSFDLIIASWQQIFTAPQATEIEVTEQVYKLANSIAIHYVKEILSLEKQTIGIVYATNIYRQTASGWKMIAHHATPAISNSETRINPNLH